MMLLFYLEIFSLLWIEFSSNLWSVPSFGSTLRNHSFWMMFLAPFDTLLSWWKWYNKPINYGLLYAVRLQFYTSFNNMLQYVLHIESYISSRINWMRRLITYCFNKFLGVDWGIFRVLNISLSERWLMDAIIFNLCIWGNCWKSFYCRKCFQWFFCF